MINSFLTWWHAPIQTKDRITAILIGGFGGLWIGVLGRIIFGPMPVSLTIIGYWALASILTGVILGARFPKIIIVLFFPFTFFSFGSS